MREFQAKQQVVRGAAQWVVVQTRSDGEETILATFHNRFQAEEAANHLNRERVEA